MSHLTPDQRADLPWQIPTPIAAVLHDRDDKGIEFKFSCNVNEEGSWGARRLGFVHDQTMTFREGDDAGHASIEWDLPYLERCEEIGLTFAWRDGRRVLTDYDGVMSLPAQAVRVLDALGIGFEESFAEDVLDAAQLSGAEIPRRAA